MLWLLNVPIWQSNTFVVDLLSDIMKVIDMMIAIIDLHVAENHLEGGLRIMIKALVFVLSYLVD